LKRAWARNKNCVKFSKIARLIADDINNRGLKMAQKPEYDICIIGGGAAGLVAAAGAAALGAKTVLVEKHALGGDCLHYGCVPSKTLIHSAKVAQTIRDAARFGVASRTPVIRLAEVMQRVQAVIAQIEPNDSPERFAALGVQVILGAGQFTGPGTFSVNGQALRARKFVIATGSRAAIPPLAGIDEVAYLTNESIFAVREEIPHLLILGGGPIGCEMAQSFRRLGSQVTLFDIAPRILPREDEDMSAVVDEQFQREGIAVHLGIQVFKVEQQNGEVRVLLKHGQRGEYRLSGSHLLVAAGRKPNLEGLGLENAGIALENGRLVLDARLRTGNKNVYACGDVAGPYLFTHMAEHQAGVVLRNALLHWPASAQTENIPWCTFTDPELARVGLSEDEARQQGVAHRVYRFPFADIDRAVAEGETSGLAKIVATPRGKLLGACIAGPHAGDLIAEYVLAIRKGMRASDLSNTIHIYPTLAQINRRVADQRLKEALTPVRRKWLQWIFGLRG
jgi:pyruvate/2-oxoglutarate dehydrogenase complex dihydrolipoamide dehydrogenase (E3) component